MEGASDFCFESAKACHAVVLTTFELGKLEWHETEKLDRFRRSHAQRHQNVSNLSQNNSRFENSSSSGKGYVICKFFTDGHCSQEVDSKTRTHITKGVIYKHCSHSCQGPHQTKNAQIRQKTNEFTSRWVGTQMQNDL